MAQKLVRQKEQYHGVDTSQSFSLVNNFLGYRNKEDKTNLPPGYLVEGSQNVLLTTGNRISVRGGYTLDGQADATIAPILSAFDWQMHTGTVQHLRAGNAKLQYRYVSGGTVVWRDLLSSLTSVNFNFADYWSTANLQALLLFVNGTGQVYEWSGGVTTFASATANTITKQGVESWAELGFYTTGTHKVTINGIDYTATGGWGTTTLTGVTPDPTSVTITAGDVIHQTPETTASSAITSLPSVFNLDLIGIYRNQVYYGDFKNRSIYVSKVNNFKDCAFTAPTRIVGEGALLTLDGNPVGLIAQEDSMYITAGQDQWYQTKFVISSDNTKEDLFIERLKTSTLQAARSQAFIGKIRNSVIFINNEPALDELGRTAGTSTQISNIGGVPVIVNNNVTPSSANMSDPIKNDFDAYDFTDGCVFYYRYFIYITVPKEGIVRIYNMARGCWEAPQLLPISRFSVIDGDLYGHSYNTPETYKLFAGHNDNGNPIDARALFSFQNYGFRELTKYFNEYYVEGYISANASITLGIQYDIDGCATNASYLISGSDNQIVCLRGTPNSLGKQSFGKNPLGGVKDIVPTTSLPPKFRVIQTFPRTDFYEVQFSFSSYGVDYQWELLAFGALATQTMYGNNSIKK